MKYLITALIIILSTFLVSKVEARLILRGRHARRDLDKTVNSKDSKKEGGYDTSEKEDDSIEDTDVVSVNLLSGSGGDDENDDDDDDDDNDGGYAGYGKAGKKEGYGDSELCAGKKGGYTGLTGGYGDGYAGKKEGYIALTGGYGDGYAGKKGGYGDGYGYGKKGGKGGGKKGTCTQNECEICGPNKKTKPTSLKLRYIPDGMESAYQTNDKSTCEEREYPSPANVTVSGFGIFKNVENGDDFLITPSSGFKAKTKFRFDDGYECEFHTSCSQPLVAGDQHGPFLIIDDDENCIESTDSPTTTPSNPPTENSCITGNVRLDGDRAVVDIKFYYPDFEPLPSDWVGLYPCSDAELQPPFNKEPKIWAYTCFDRNCRSDDPSTVTGIGSFTFEHDNLPTYISSQMHKTLDELITEEPGCYVIKLNRIDGDSAPPYYGICDGNEIQLVPGLRLASTPIDSSRVTCGDIPSDGCSVCGEGKYVSTIDAIFAFPGQPTVECGILETAGFIGEIPLAQCEFLPSLINDNCDCQECESSPEIDEITSGNTGTPPGPPTTDRTPNPTPTTNSTIKPTPGPTIEPTPKPTVGPTVGPTPEPTPKSIPLGHTFAPAFFVHELPIPDTGSP